ncbi:MAG TPA: hypothetical protein DCZ49_04140 [Hyphomonadaceae bacterium]|nr:hypothetical protein [Hyphomonadaceae bacterium]
MLETAEGAPTGLKWIIDAEPGWSDQPFSIHLVYMSHPIWRAEIKKRCSHVNKPPVPTGCDVGLIEGPHHHPWQLNRHLCKLDGPPQQLKFAAPLPPQVVKFENAIRWFAAAARIAIDFELPHYPTKGLL